MLDKLIQDNQAQKVVKTEVEVWRKLGNHPNVVRFISAQQVKNADGSSDMLILNELCNGGTLIDVIARNNQQLSESQILTIMKDIIAGVKHMHQMGIAHRDLKVENVLLHDSKHKLADFGSASFDTLDYTTASKVQIAKHMELFEKYTTLTYRPPEMIEQYLKYKVDLKVDIWMLGCILYSLCFARHPFQDVQQLAIINAHYNMVAHEDKYEHISDKMKDLIRVMLTPNPEKRPTIWELEMIVTSFNQIPQIQLSDDALEIKKRQEEFEKVKGKREKGILQLPQLPKKNQANKDNAHFEGDEWFGFQEQDKDDQVERWDQTWSQQPSNNPFDAVVDQEDQQQNNQQQVNNNPFDMFTNAFNNIKNKTQEQNWFFNFGKREQDQNENGESWTQWDEENEKQETLDQEDTDEHEKPNMFEQINNLKQQSK